MEMHKHEGREEGDTGRGSASSTRRGGIGSKQREA